MPVIPLPAPAALVDGGGQRRTSGVTMPDSHSTPDTDTKTKPPSDPDTKTKEAPRWTETRKINFADIAGDRPVPRPCVLPGLRARQIGMLTSAGGVGKSFLALRACIEMAAGLPVLGGIWGEAREGGQPVVYASLEDDLDDILIRVFDICEFLGIRTLATLVLLERNLVICNASCLAAHPGVPPGIILPTDTEGKPVNPKLIIIDTLTRFMDGGDENSSAVMTAVFKVIEGHLATYDAAALILHHISKADMGAEKNDMEASNSSRGSSVITFNARAAWTLSCPSQKAAKQHEIPDEDRWQYAVLKQTKINYGMPHAPQWFRKHAEGVPVPITEPRSSLQSPERLPQNQDFFSGPPAERPQGRCALPERFLPETA